jgi:dihydrofolate synthase/folylpolyglutamate synthase
MREALKKYWPSAERPRHSDTLERSSRLLDYLGNPQEQYRVIHVAGTSGKTSTAYYAAALLKGAGHKTGLTVSPNVDEINERVQINLTPMPEAEFCDELNTFIALVEQGGFMPNYFELLQYFAFWEFARQKVAYAVVEVGVGGLLDSTNAVRRADKVCVITDIGLDHMHLLGDTVGKIAAHKAGIIHAGNTVFCYKQAAEIMQPIRAATQRYHADLHMVSEDADACAADLPAFQRRNFHLAKTAVIFTLQAAGRALPMDAALRQAAHTHIPARMETVRLGGKIIIMDGAHNGQKIQALVRSVQEQYPGEEIAVLAGFLSDHPDRVADVAYQLAAFAHFLIITGFAGKRDGPKHAETPAAVAAMIPAGKAYTVIEDPEAAFQALCQRPEKVLVVTGSFYLLNHIRPLVLHN